MLRWIFVASCCAGFIGFVPSPAQAQKTAWPASGVSVKEAYGRILGYDVAWPDTLRTRPPLKAGRLAGQYAAGMAIGTATGLIFGLAGLAYVAGNDEICRGSTDYFCGAGYIGMGFIVGLTLGSAGGVHALGTRSDQTASFLNTLGGSALGATLFLWAAREHDETNDLQNWFLLSLPTFGAMIAFNATRRYPPAARPGTAALINGQRGVWRLAVPPIAPCPDPLTLGQTRAYQISLLHVRF